jgi:hypothetical protein
MEQGHSGTFMLPSFKSKSGTILTELIVRIPREPKEVHSRHEDGIWWIEEGQGPERPDHVRVSKKKSKFIAMKLTIL